MMTTSAHLCKQKWYGNFKANEHEPLHWSEMRFGLPHHRLIRSYACCTGETFRCCCAGVHCWHLLWCVIAFGLLDSLQNQTHHSNSFKWYKPCHKNNWDSFCFLSRKCHLCHVQGWRILVVITQWTKLQSNGRAVLLIIYRPQVYAFFACYCQITGVKSCCARSSLKHWTCSPPSFIWDKTSKCSMRFQIVGMPFGQYQDWCTLWWQQHKRQSCLSVVSPLRVYFTAQKNKQVSCFQYSVFWRLSVGSSNTNS